MTDFGTTLRMARRGKGLSQLDLAGLSGTTQRYVSFLESGRSAPGRDILGRLADALGLQGVQRAHLFASAGYTDGAAAGPIDGAVMETATRIIAQQDPYPALVLNLSQDILATNSGFDRLLAFAARRSDMNLAAIPGPRNLLRLVFHECGLFSLVRDPAGMVAAVMGRVLGEARGDPCAQQVVADVLDYPHIRGLRSCAQPADNGEVLAEHYQIGDAEIGLMCLVTNIGAPGSASAQALRLEQFHPVNEQTEAVIRKAFAEEAGVIPGWE